MQTMKTYVEKPLTKENNLTIEKLKSYRGCENLSDEQALNAIQTIEKLAVILFDYVCHQNGIVIDNQVVIVSTDIKTDLKQAA
ncbi:MAG: hypothetical protein JST82_11160 [Bacteroidetes bacterium]|nr:hypothetical protein [Bacteroidota bacterium]